MKIQNNNDNLFAAEFHLHPFLENGYDFNDIDNVAYEKKIDFLNLVRFDREIYDNLRKRAEKLTGSYSDDDVIVSCRDNRRIYYPRGVEILTKEGFQVTIIGSHKNKIKPGQSIYKTLDSAIEEEDISILHHPLVDSKYVEQDIDYKKFLELVKICKQYSNHLFLEIDALCKPYLKKIIGTTARLMTGHPGGTDVNKRTCKLSRDLYVQGYNVPCVSVSDIHARKYFLLKEMDRAETYFNRKNINEESSGKDLIKSIKHCLVKREYTSETSNPQVSLLNFTAGFGIPYLCSKFSLTKNLFKNPRG